MGTDEMTTEPVFLRFRRYGKVHVLRGLEDTFAKHAGLESSVATVLMAKQVSLCGKYGGPGALNGVSAFADEDLCWRCRGLYQGDVLDLFKHQTID